jgi:hypothetical protein
MPSGLAFVPQDKLDFNCKYAKVQWFLVHKVLIKFMNKVLKYFLHQKYGLGIRVPPSGCKIFILL